jgi:molybdopterin-guanine dinucleotide biosynthesis protein B
MQPIISIIGQSDSGKTTLLVRLVAELTQHHYKVAVIKHTADDFELDQAGKDSWRLSQAGNGVVAISAPHRVAIIKPASPELSPQEIARLIGNDHDLVLTEGFRRSNTPKIEVHRQEQGKALSCPPQQLLAVVSDEPLDVSVPQFPPDEIHGLVNLIEQWLESRLKQDDVELTINQTFIPIKPFVRDMLTRTLLAMVSSLKGVKQIQSLRISIRRRA